MEALSVLAGLVLALGPDVGQVSPEASLTVDGEPGCTLGEHALCVLPGRIDEATAATRLADARESFWVEDGLLHVVARRSAPEVRLCCALQTRMDQVGENGIWGMSYALNRLDEAFVDVFPRPGEEDGTKWPQRPIYRGDAALPPVPRVETLAGTTTNTEFDSAALGQPRNVTYYEPPGDGPHPVIFVADGGNVNAYAPIAEALVATCRARPVVMIGLWTEGVTAPPESLADDPRSRDYLWTVDEAGFMAHQRFLTDELVPFSHSEFGASERPEDRMVFGASSGAAWAISTALLHPDMIRHAGAASLGWPDALDAAEAVDPRLAFHISAGLYEPGFLSDSEAAVTALQDAGARAEMTTYVSGHSSLNFEQQFAHAVSAAFPAEEGCVPREDVE